MIFTFLKNLFAAKVDTTEDKKHPLEAPSLLNQPKVEETPVVEVKKEKPVSKAMQNAKARSPSKKSPQGKSTKAKAPVKKTKK